LHEKESEIQRRKQLLLQDQKYMPLLVEGRADASKRSLGSAERINTKQKEKRPKISTFTSPLEQTLSKQESRFSLEDEKSDLQKMPV
jgi:hypothetical protein